MSFFWIKMDSGFHIFDMVKIISYRIKSKFSSASKISSFDLSIYSCQYIRWYTEFDWMHGHVRSITDRIINLFSTYRLLVGNYYILR